MKKNTILKIIALSMSLSATATFATSMDSSITLCTDQTIPFMGALTLPLSGLQQYGMLYNVTCQMTDGTSSSITLRASAQTGSFPVIRLNNQNINYQFSIIPGPNTLLMGGVTAANGELIIASADTSNSVTDVTCTAVAEPNSYTR